MSSINTDNFMDFLEQDETEPLLPGFKPNAKYKHVFAVVRTDRYDQETEFFSVVKVTTDFARAEAEAKRLNELKKNRFSHYEIQVTRLDESEGEV